MFREAYKAARKLNLGILYYRQNDLKKSREYFEAAILDSPSLSCVAYYYRGHFEFEDFRF